MKLQGAHGDILGKHNAFPIVDGQADGAGADIRDQRRVYFFTGVLHSAVQDFRVNQCLFLVILQNLDGHVVLNFNLIHYVSTVFGLPQNRGGHHLILGNAVFQHHLGVSSQHRDHFLQAVKADFSCGKHLVADLSWVSEHIDIGNGAVAKLGNPHLYQA